MVNKRIFDNNNKIIVQYTNLESLNYIMGVLDKKTLPSDTKVKDVYVNIDYSNKSERIKINPRDYVLIDFSDNAHTKVKLRVLSEIEVSYLISKLKEV